MSGTSVTEFPSTDVKSIRARNRAEIRQSIDQRRTHAILNVMERLDVYGALVVGDPNAAASIPSRRTHAANIVDAVLAFMRGSSEWE